MEITGNIAKSSPGSPPSGLQPPPHVFQNTNRETAESLLLNAPQGTYLFRKGGQDKQLERTLRMPCYTLTWNGENQMISEKVVVQSPKGYQFYDDDLTLSGKAFSTLSALMSTLNPSLSTQLRP